MVSNFKLDPNNLPTLTPEQEARLDAMTDAEIGAAAASDPDNPPLTDEEIGRFYAARVAKRARRKAGLSQRAFSDKFHIGHARLRDIESSRNKRSDSAIVAYLSLIENDPIGVARVLERISAGEPNASPEPPELVRRVRTPRSVADKVTLAMAAKQKNAHGRKIRLRIKNKKAAS